MKCATRSSSASNIQLWFLLVAALSLFSGFTYTKYAVEVDYHHHLGDVNVDEAAKNLSPGRLSFNTSTPSVSGPRSSTIRTPRDIFDCNQTVSSCVYFEPSTYFDANRSPLPPRILDSVKNFWSNQYNASNGHERDLFWFSIHQDVGVYNLLNWNDYASNSSAPSPPSGWPRTMMGLHIHKCGGSSVGRTFLRLSKSGSKVAKPYEVTLFYMHNLRSKFRHQQTSWERLSVDMHTRLLQQVLDNQQSEAPVDHVAFTFVRDPVARFLSSVREFLVSRNRRKLCLDAANGKEVLQCFLSRLQKENGLQMDQHFVPATISLFMFTLLEPRVKLSILPLTKEVMADFQTAFLGVQKKAINAKSSHPKHYNIHMNLLDQAMIQDICTLYQMDVYLMRHLGFATPYCTDE
jgi:hypothetical protein